MFDKLFFDFKTWVLLEQSGEIKGFLTDET